MARAGAPGDDGDSTSDDSSESRTDSRTDRRTDSRDTSSDTTDTSSSTTATSTSGLQARGGDAYNEPSSASTSSGTDSGSDTTSATDRDSMGGPAPAPDVGGETNQSSGSGDTTSGSDSTTTDSGRSSTPTQGDLEPPAQGGDAYLDEPTSDDTTDASPPGSGSPGDDLRTRPESGAAYPGQDSTSDTPPGPTRGSSGSSSAPADGATGANNGGDWLPPEADDPYGLEDNSASPHQKQARSYEDEIVASTPLTEDDVQIEIVDGRLVPRLTASRDTIRERLAARRLDVSPEDIDIVDGEITAETETGENALQLSAAEQYVTSEFPDAQRYSITGVVDDGYKATITTESGDTVTRIIPFSDAAAKSLQGAQSPGLDPEAIEQKVKAANQLYQTDAQVGAMQDSAAEPTLTGGFPDRILEAAIEGDNPGVDVDVTRQPGFEPEVRVQDRWDVDLSMGLGGPGDEIEQAIDAEAQQWQSGAGVGIPGVWRGMNLEEVTDAVYSGIDVATMVDTGAAMRSQQAAASPVGVTGVGGPGFGWTPQQKRDFAKPFARDLINAANIPGWASGGIEFVETSGTVTFENRRGAAEQFYQSALEADSINDVNLDEIAGQAWVLASGVPGPDSDLETERAIASTGIDLAQYGAEYAQENPVKAAGSGAAIVTGAALSGGAYVAARRGARAASWGTVRRAVDVDFDDVVAPVRRGTAGARELRARTPGIQVVRDPDAGLIEVDPAVTRQLADAGRNLPSRAASGTSRLLPDVRRPRTPGPDVDVGDIRKRAAVEQANLYMGFRNVAQRARRVAGRDRAPGLPDLEDVKQGLAIREANLAMRARGARQRLEAGAGTGLDRLRQANAQAELIARGTGRQGVDLLEEAQQQMIDAPGNLVRVGERMSTGGQQAAGRGLQGARNVPGWVRERAFYGAASLETTAALQYRGLAQRLASVEDPASDVAAQLSAGLSDVRETAAMLPQGIEGTLASPAYTARDTVRGAAATLGSLDEYTLRVTPGRPPRIGNMEFRASDFEDADFDIELPGSLGTTGAGDLNDVDTPTPGGWRSGQPSLLQAVAKETQASPYAVGVERVFGPAEAGLGLASTGLGLLEGVGQPQASIGATGFVGLTPPGATISGPASTVGQQGATIATQGAVQRIEAAQQLSFAGRGTGRGVLGGVRITPFSGVDAFTGLGSTFDQPTQLQQDQDQLLWQFQTQGPGFAPPPPGGPGKRPPNIPGLDLPGPDDEPDPLASLAFANVDFDNPVAAPGAIIGLNTSGGGGGGLDVDATGGIFDSPRNNGGSSSGGGVEDVDPAAGMFGGP